LWGLSIVLILFKDKTLIWTNMKHIAYIF
jgi:hypothetical protein